MAVNPRTDETRQLEHVKQDLVREFAQLPSHVIDETFAQVVGAFDRARVRSFVPVLARRGAQQRLRQLA